MADQAKPSREFSDAELIEIANDSTITPQDLSKLSAADAARFAALRQSKPVNAAQTSLTSKMGRAMDVGEDVARGVVKGGGETAFHLGDLMRHLPSDLLIPGLSVVTGAKTVGDLGGLIGGMSSDQAFSQVPQDLQATNTAQKFGKGAEQIGEFFIPAGKAGLASRGAAELVGKLPKAAGTIRKLATDAAWKLGPVVDNALSTGAVAMAHGEDNPQYAAGTQAGVQTAGLGLAQLTKMLEMSVGKQYAPILAAILLGKGIYALTGDPGTALGSGLAMNSATRALTRRVLSQPGAAGKLLWGTERAGERAGTLGAGAVDETRRRRREP